MFLLYLDDSGSAKNSIEEYLVLGGVCVSEHQVNELTHALEALAFKYDSNDPDSVEFHASAIFSGRDKPWIGLPRPVKAEILKEVLGVINTASAPACALGCAVHKASFPDHDPMELAFSELCGWFDEFLKARHLESGNDEKGIIFLDESTHETSLRRIARTFRRSGLTTENGRYIVDGPHFVKSDTTRCVQLADHVAYAIFRYFNALDSNYLNVVLNRFQSNGRVLTGLQHMHANKADCICPACLTERACAGTLVRV